MNSKKPECLRDEHITLLTNLKNSGGNIYNAAFHLFGSYPDLSYGQAKEIVAYWMDNFIEEFK